MSSPPPLRDPPAAARPPPRPAWVKAFWAGAVLLVVAVIVLHLTGHAPHHGMAMPPPAQP